MELNISITLDKEIELISLFSIPFLKFNCAITLANKAQIKNAIQRLYNVKVVDVRTANQKGKVRRKGRTIGRTRSWKKAIIVLSEDHNIDLF